MIVVMVVVVVVVVAVEVVVIASGSGSGSGGVSGGFCGIGGGSGSDFFIYLPAFLDTGLARGKLHERGLRSHARFHPYPIPQPVKG